MELNCIGKHPNRGAVVQTRFRAGIGGAPGRKDTAVRGHGVSVPGVVQLPWGVVRGVY